MNWRTFSFLVFFNWVPVLADDVEDSKKLFDHIQRRLGRRQKILYVFPVLGSQVPKNNDSLEPGGKDMPGSTVYGNLNNLGIAHGTKSDRIKYSAFRRNSGALILIQKPPSVNVINGPSTEDESFFETRRNRKIKHMNRKELYETDESDTSSSSSSSEYEKNPGNPFTIHKNRYRQNWMWNHAMTGDHMNINPKAPVFNNLGPTGAELFFGRKWWYFNQDDYVPFR